MSKVGPHGEMLVSRGTKEQTFRREAIVADRDWDKVGPCAIADLLRALAHDIDLHAKHGFQTDPRMTHGSFPDDVPYRPSEPIKTSLINMEASAFISEPPAAYFAHLGSMDSGWRLGMTLRLQFQ